MRGLAYISSIFIGLLWPDIALADIFVGKVLDETGGPLVGAVVKIEGVGKAVMTDSEGMFRFDVSDKSVVEVEVSYIGFDSCKRILKSVGQPKDNMIRLIPSMMALEEVVVTATRTPKALKDVPVVTRLITSSDIEKTDASDIKDLLIEELPGLEFGFAMSQETSLSMSGFGGNAILFLVDGERMAGETMDNVDYSRLTLGNVEQVEIVKGASSALYGANAVGGVVNLISKESNEPWRLNFGSRYHSAGNEWRTVGDVSFNTRYWNSNTSVQYSESGNIRLTDAFDTESKIHEIFGGRSLNLKERLVYRASDALKFIARGSYFSRTSNRANYDDKYNDYAGGLKGVWLIDATQNMEISYGYDRYDKARYVDASRTHDHDYSNRQHYIHALYSKFWGATGLTVGADYMNDYLATYQFAGNNPHTQSSVDAFVQLDYTPLPWLNVIASVRDDYFSGQGNNALTSRLASMFKLKQFSVRASYSGGFRAPTLKEMYMCFDMAGIQMIYGNPDLKPERSHNFSIAIERNGRLCKSSYSLSLSVFYNNYNSRITTTDYPGGNGQEAGAVYCNEQGVKVTGADINARIVTDFGVGASINYNYLHTVGSKIDSQFSQPRPHSATWRVDYTKRISGAYSLYAGISGRYLAKPISRYETDESYMLWKFTLRQNIYDGVNIHFAVDNLFGHRPRVYYWNSAPTAGRTWSVGVSVDADVLFNLLRRA